MDLEPYPIDKGDPLYEEGTYQWLERYEYIESRAETYLDYYRDNMEYDFTRTLGDVKRQQTATLDAYCRFASGSMKALGVEAQVKMLRDAFKKKIATPLTPEERAKINPPYVPQWRKDWEAKKAKQKEDARKTALLEQPSPDHTRFIVERGYYGSADPSPMPGLNCYSINEDQGYTEAGEKVDKGRGYVLVLWDAHETFNPEAKGRPEFLIPGYEGQTPPVKKTLDELKREIAAAEHKAELDKLDKRLKRGAGR